jgi:NitT/TauT family transport system substrate-binding protein
MTTSTAAHAHDIDRPTGVGPVRNRLARGRRWVVACLALLPLATGCTAVSEHTDGARAVDQVTFLTGLGQTGREGYAYVADAKGFFAAEHIKVAVKAGQAGEYNLQLLRGGQAQFVAIDYSGAVVRAGTGKFDGVRCIAVLQQRTTIALMALARSGITSARDLIGRTIAQPAGAVTKTLFPAYAKLARLDPAQIATVSWIDAPGAQLPSLLAAGKVDAIGQFVPAAPTVSAAAKGAQVTVLPYGDYMGDLYGNVLVTRTDVEPDLQRRFTRALFRGLAYAVDHPDEAGQIIHAAAPTTPAAGAAAELRLLKPYVGAPVANPDLVARSIALMQGIGMIPAPIPPEQVFDFAIAPSATPTNP